MICAIHQPNFLPWLGYFDKIIKSDIFVFMDDVAYSKGGRTNRVSIPVQGKAQWLTCPIKREHGIQKIKNVKLDNSINWKRKIIMTIEQSYKKTMYFGQIMPYIEEMFNSEEEHISNWNIQNIRLICSILDIKRNLVHQSDLHTKQASTKLLVEIVKKAGADEYLCGDGAQGYQDDELIKSNDIKLTYQNFQHPEYIQQSDEFISGMSVIDALFNCGITGVQTMLGF